MGKKSSICEILPPGTPLPGTEAADIPIEGDSNPAAAATTGASASGPDVKITEAPRVPLLDEGDEEDGLDDKPIEDDGVLDIATIVTSGKTQDFLAKKEKEKAERAAARKADREAAKEAAAAAAARPLRLPNSKRPRATFHYEEVVKDAPNAKRQKTPEAAPAAVEEPAAAVEPKPDDVIPPVDEAPAPVEDERTRIRAFSGKILRSGPSASKLQAKGIWILSRMQSTEQSSQSTRFRSGKKLGML